jgi:hypothetical protein
MAKNVKNSKREKKKNGRNDRVLAVVLKRQADLHFLESPSNQPAVHIRITNPVEDQTWQENPPGMLPGTILFSGVSAAGFTARLIRSDGVTVACASIGAPAGGSGAVDFTFPAANVPSGNHLLIVEALNSAPSVIASDDVVVMR